MTHETGSLTATPFLQRLLGCTSLDEFHGEVFERQPRLFQQATTVGGLRDIFTLNRLDELFSSIDLRYPQIELIEDGAATRPPTLLNGVVDRIQFLNRLRRGASLRINDLQVLLPNLMDISRGLALELLGKVNVTAYVTPPGEQAFSPHFDDHDVFIVQCFGEKHWAVNRTYERQIALPNPHVLAASHNHTRRSDPSCEQHFILRQGDVLYLPRGTLHYAKSTNQGSIHLTIGYSPVTIGKLLRLAISKAERLHVEFRRSAYGDLCRPNDGSRQAISASSDLLARAVLDDEVGAARDEIAASYPSPTEGMMCEIFAPIVIAEDTRFALRTNSAFRVRRDPTGSVVGLTNQRTELGLQRLEAAWFTKMTQCETFCPSDLAEENVQTECVEFLGQLLRHGVVRVVD